MKKLELRLVFSVATGLALSVMADELPWKFDTSKRKAVDPVPVVAVTGANLDSREAVRRTSDEGSDLTSVTHWTYYSNLADIGTTKPGLVLIVR